MKSRARRLRMFGVLLSALLALASQWLAGAALAGTTPGGPLYVPNQYIVRARAGASYSTVQQNVAKMGGTIVQTLALANTYLMKLGVAQSGGAPRSTFKPLGQWVIEHIQPNVIYHATATPNDEFYLTKQWNMPSIRCPAAWDITKGDSGIRVAVVDTGVAYDHPDLAARCMTGYDFVGANDSDPYDEEGHGTHVAGIIGAQGDNDIGVCGVCWDGVKIMPIRVLGPMGGTDPDIIEGLDYALTRGAQVVNMSLGGPAGMGDEALHAKIVQLVNAGVIVVASAGNDASDVGSPAVFPEVICVASTAPDDSIATYSSFGPGYEVDIAAPGGDSTRFGDEGKIYSTIVTYTGPVKSLGYAYEEGTSMAAPHVAGAAALMLSHGVSRQDVRARLQDTARRPPAGMYDRRKYGAGIVDLIAALTEASITIVAPVKGSTVSTNPAFKIKLRGFESLSAFNSIKVYFDYADDGDGIPDASAETPIIDQSNLYLYTNAARTEIDFTWSELMGLDARLKPGKHYIYAQGDPLTGGNPVYDWGTFEVAAHTEASGVYMFAMPIAVDTSLVSPSDILTNADFNFANPMRAVLRRYITTLSNYATYYPGNPFDLAWVNPWITWLNPPVSGLPSGGATFDLVKRDDAGVEMARRANQFGYPVGTGFWLILSEPSPVSDAYPPLENTTTPDGYVFDAEKGCKIRLYKGWNMVGNPYTRPIPLGGARVSYQGVTKSLQEATAAGWISPVVYGYRTTGAPGYYNVNVPFDGILRPYRGYWFWALKGGTSDTTALNLHLLP